MSSKINYVDETWEVTAGCTKVSAGCLNCYAARLSATRLKHHADCQGLAISRDSVTDWVGDEIGIAREYDWTGEVRLLPHNLSKPLHWRKPRRVFVNSRSDLFHESVPFEYIDDVFRIVSICRHHTFLMLTKRADRMREYVQSRMHKSFDTANHGCAFLPFRNLWLGVTAENQEQADARIPLLLQTPAAVRFVSVEPMLGPVDLGDWLCCTACADTHGGSRPKAGLGVIQHCGNPQLSWIICGGESGPGARPMHPDWARSIRYQCEAAGVPFWFKQWGEWFPRECWGDDNPDLWLPDDCYTYNTTRPDVHREEFAGEVSVWHRVGKAAAGNVLDGRVWEQTP